MTIGMSRQAEDAVLLAVTPSYAAPNPYYASPLPGRSFTAHMWLLVARLGPVSSYTSDAVRSVVHVGPATLEVAEMVRSLRDGGLSVTALAEMMLVERKSVYAWLDGGEVRPSNDARVRTLYSLLAVFASDYKSVWRVSSRPVASGTNLRSLLTANVLDISAIKSALDELRSAIKQHVARDADRLVVRSRVNPVLAELPVADLGDQDD